MLLAPHLPIANPVAIAGTESVAEAVHTTLYDELNLLRSCALDRRYSGAGSANGMAGGGSEQDRPAKGRSHMLWLGLRLDPKNLKWWWW